MSRKLFCLAVAVVIVGTIFVSAYLASAAPQGKGNKRVLSKVKFIHYRKGYGKPEGTPGGGKAEDKGYYTYISKGAKWKLTEDYLLNPGNNHGNWKSLVSNAVEAGMEEWDNEVNFTIFGNVEVDYEATYEYGNEPQDENTISFQNFGSGNENVIAVAIVWGYFSGPPSQRVIIEAHILLNDADFDWGDATLDNTLMDVQNIVTHELGHCAGMGDVYQPRANEETMYGYSTAGETDKRDLYTGDITGITKLYE